MHLPNLLDIDILPPFLSIVPIFVSEYKVVA
jgi:hypothetical protein